MEVFIERASVRRQGDITHYRVVGREVDSLESKVGFEADVGVRCSTGERVEYESTTRWRGNSNTVTSTTMTPVKPGTRAAREVDVACRLAEYLASRGALQPLSSPGATRAPLPPMVRSTAPLSR